MTEAQQQDRLIRRKETSSTASFAAGRGSQADNSYAARRTKLCQLREELLWILLPRQASNLRKRPLEAFSIPRLTLDCFGFNFALPQPRGHRRGFRRKG